MCSAAPVEKHCVILLFYCIQSALLLPQRGQRSSTEILQQHTGSDGDCVCFQVVSLSLSLSVKVTFIRKLCISHKTFLQSLKEQNTHVLLNQLWCEGEGDVLIRRLCHSLSPAVSTCPHCSRDQRRRCSTDDVWNEQWHCSTDVYLRHTHTAVVQCLWPTCGISCCLAAAENCTASFTFTFAATGAFLQHRYDHLEGRLWSRSLEAHIADSHSQQSTAHTASPADVGQVSGHNTGVFPPSVRAAHLN